MASKRLAADQRLFEELTANVFTYILNIWNTYTESFFTLLSRGVNDNDVQDSIEKALLCLRILRKLLMNGIKKPSENENAMIFLKMIFDRANISLNCSKYFFSITFNIPKINSVLLEFMCGCVFCVFPIV